MSRSLLQLIRDNLQNRAAGKPAGIRAEAGDDGLNVYVYDFIDSYFGCSAQDMLQALASATPGQQINLHINSPGGDVMEARAMSAALVAHKGPVVAYIDGLAASAATFLALTAETVNMIEGGLFMIHNASSFAYGNATDLRTTADLLDKVDAQLVADYAKRTGQTPEQIAAWMAAETWMTETEALENGFITAITPNTKAAGAQAVAGWNLSAFTKAPKVATPSAEIDEEALTAQVQANRNRLRLFETI